MNKKMDNKGFSLVELIIVIAIMAILVGVLAPQFIKYVNKSRIAKDIQNVQEVKTAIEVLAAGGEGLADSFVITGAADKITFTPPTGMDVTSPVEFDATWTKTGDAKYTYDKDSFTWSASGDLTITHDGHDYSIAEDVFNITTP